MSLNINPNTHIQANEPNKPEIQINPAQPKNEALGNVQPTSTLARVGRVLLGVFTLGISEGIRALVNWFSSKDPADPRINVNPNAPVKRRESNFNFETIEAKLGRKITDKEREAFDAIEHNLLLDKKTGKENKKTGMPRVQEFQEDVIRILDVINEKHRYYANQGTAPACKSILMQHPEMLLKTEERNPIDVKQLLSLCPSGPFVSFTNTLKDRNKLDPTTTEAEIQKANSTLAQAFNTIAFVIYHSPIAVRDQDLQKAQFRLVCYVAIEGYKLAPEFRALPDEAKNGIQTAIQNLKEGKNRDNALIFFETLREISASEPKKIED